jgi:hypothetical protein
LLATILKSAYLVQSDDAEDRQARLRRAILTYVETGRSSPTRCAPQV